MSQRQDADYADKLDGKISEDHYLRASNLWKDERRRCEDELTRYLEASDAYVEDGVALLRLASDANQIFENKPGPARRKLLTFVL